MFNIDKASLLHEASVRALFKQFDRDGDDIITPEDVEREFKTFGKQLTKAETHEFIRIGSFGETLTMEYPQFRSVVLSN